MRMAPLVLLLPLMACAAPERPPVVTAAIVAPPAPPQRFEVPGNLPPQECVSYARQVTGIKIFGDAWTWWDGAPAAHYERASRHSWAPSSSYARRGRCSTAMSPW